MQLAKSSTRCLIIRTPYLRISYTQYRFVNLRIKFMSTIYTILKHLHLIDLLEDDLSPLCLNGEAFLSLLTQKRITNNLQGKELLLVNKLAAKRSALLKMLLRENNLILDENERILIEFCKALESNFKKQFPKLSILKQDELIFKDKILNLSEAINKIIMHNKELSYTKILMQAIFERSCFKLQESEITHILKTSNSKSFAFIKKNLDKFSLNQYIVYLAFLHHLAVKDKNTALNLLLERSNKAFAADKQEIKKGELQLINIYAKASDMYHFYENDLGKWLYFMYTKGRENFSTKEQLWISDCFITFFLNKNVQNFENNRQKSILNFFTYLKFKENITISN